jgi:CheY-like chemotaxis protein
LKRNNLIAVVVDDDQDDLDFIVTALKDTGVITSIKEFSNAMEALTFLEGTSQLPDMIVLDFKMPILSGLALLEKIKSDKRLENIPVFMFSTSSYKQDVENARDMGANNFITKPYDYKGFAQAADIIIDIFMQAISPEPFHRILIR